MMIYDIVMMYDDGGDGDGDDDATLSDIVVVAVVAVTIRETAIRY